MDYRNYYFIDRVFPSLSDMESYQARQEKDRLLDNVKSIIGSSNLYLNPFDVNHRIALTDRILCLRPELASLHISQQDTEKIYWGILSPRISKKPWDEKMNSLVRNLWEKHHTIEGIAKALYDLNNSQIHIDPKKTIYIKRNKYTPLHEIQAFLESNGLEAWTLEEEERLIWGASAYEGLYPSSSARRGYRTLEDFKTIAQFPELQGVVKTPEQMLDQWNQRSSLWLIGQEIRKEDEKLLKELFLGSFSAEELSDAFAARKGGKYYPDKVIADFWHREIQAEVVDVEEFWSSLKCEEGELSNFEDVGIIARSVTLQDVVRTSEQLLDP